MPFMSLVFPAMLVALALVSIIVGLSDLAVQWLFRR